MSFYIHSWSIFSSVTFKKNVYSWFYITFPYIVYFVPKFVVTFKSSYWNSQAAWFVNKASDWSQNKNKPIKCIVRKPVCEYDYELLNFATKFVTICSQHSWKSYVKSTVTGKHNNDMKIVIIETITWLHIICFTWNKLNSIL